VTIIGAGAVGSSLALALHHVDYPLHAIVSRTEDSAHALARRLRLKHYATIDAFRLPKDGIVVIAVPDDALAELASSLASGAQEEEKSRAMVLHTSGALPADTLAPLRALGVSVGSFHPLMLFPKGQSRGTEFVKCPVAIEGDPAAAAAALKLAHVLKARPFVLPAEKKTLYHIAAVFASNYFVTLLSAVGKAGAAIELPAEERLALFEPLIRQTLDAVLRTSPHEALTGPIVRNDRTTIRRHLEALEKLGNNDLLSLYIELGLATAHLAKEHE
jgi:predicted short-subunit dehydrogenase-like oxidoreductase (DUF2520 family)